MSWYFVPEDWEPSDKLIEWTKSKGLSDRQIEDELEKFRDHQYKRPMMRADACWRNWVRIAIERGHVVPTVEKVYRQPQELSEDERSADILKFERDMQKLGVKQ